MTSPHISVGRTLPLSLFNLDGDLTDSLLLPYNDIPRTINRDMTRAAVAQNHLPRTAIHNDMSQVAAHTKMTQFSIQNEVLCASVHNGMSQSAMKNELLRNVHNKRKRMALPF